MMPLDCETEVLIAQRAYWAGGDPWPLAILRFRAGETAPLEQLIRDGGVPAGAAACFVADVVSRKFRRSRTDTVRFRHSKVVFEYAALVGCLEFLRANPSMVSVLDGALVNDPDLFLDGRMISTVDDVVEVVARKTGETAENVRQIVKRRRRSVKGAVEGR